MATTAKKTRRRALRRGRIDLLCSDETPVMLVADLEAEAVTIDVATIEAADDPRSPAKFTARVYNGTPMSPRVRQYDTGGTPIVIDLAKAKVSRGGSKTPVLYAHDRNDPIGHTSRVDVLPSSINAEGVLSVPGPSRDKVVGGAADGFRWAVSVGFEATELEYISQSDTATVNGRQMKGPLYVARRGTVKEISLLTIGAEGTATATVSATLANPTEPYAMPPELRAFIEAAGFTPDDLTDAQLEHFTAQHAASIEAGDDKDTSPTPATPAAVTPTIEAGDESDPVAEMRRNAAAELARQNRITEICAQHKNPSVQVQGVPKPLNVIAIEAGWDETRTELEAMRASRPAAPAAHVSDRSQTHTIEAVSAGLLMRCGVDLEDSGFRTIEAAEAGTPGWLNASTNNDRFQRTAENGRRFREASLMDICAAAVEAETGVRPYGKRAIIEAAFSSASVASLFGTSVGARALMTFNEATDTTAGFVTRATVPDFESHERVGLEAMESLSHQPSGGEAEHAKRRARNETAQAARYSKQYVIDEQDLIGDRLGLLSSTPAQMGRAAGRMIPDLVYWLFLANPTMIRTGRAAFHSTDGTLLSAAALDVAPLKLAIASLMKQKDGDATLNLNPTHLITGAELADTAVQLCGSPMFSNDSGGGNRNPLSRYGINPVADARISNGVANPKTGVLASGSATAWYLLSTDNETIEVQTVEGTGGVPVVRVSNLTQGRWGLHVDVKYDVGASINENRGMRKNAGS